MDIYDIEQRRTADRLLAEGYEAEIFMHPKAHLLYICFTNPPKEFRRCHDDELLLYYEDYGYGKILYDTPINDLWACAHNDVKNNKWLVYIGQI